MGLWCTLVENATLFGIWTSWWQITLTSIISIMLKMFLHKTIIRILKIKDWYLRKLHMQAAKSRVEQNWSLIKWYYFILATWIEKYWKIMILNVRWHKFAAGLKLQLHVFNCSDSVRSFILKWLLSINQLINLTISYPNSGAGSALPFCFHMLASFTIPVSKQPYPQVLDHFPHFSG